MGNSLLRIGHSDYINFRFSIGYMFRSGLQFVNSATATAAAANETFYNHWCAENLKKFESGNGYELF